MNSDDAPYSRQPIDILQKVRIVRREMERYSMWAEKRFGVTDAQVSLLLDLHDNPGRRMTEVQESIGVHQATASNIVEKMVKRGLVAKKRNKEDKRGVHLFLTGEGETFVLRNLMPLRMNWVNLFVRIDPLVLGTINAGLEALIAASQEFAHSEYGFGLDVAAPDDPSDSN